MVRGEEHVVLSPNNHVAPKYEVNIFGYCGSAFVALDSGE